MTLWVKREVLPQLLREQGRAPGVRSTATPVYELENPVREMWEMVVGE